MSLNRALVRLAALVAVFATAGCAETPSTPLAPGASELTAGSLQLVQQPVATAALLAQSNIGPAGGTLQIPGGHTLQFPAGALKKTTTITASRDPNSISVNFGPEGLVFPSDARPTLTYSYGNATLPSWVEPGSLRIMYVDRAYVEVLDTYIDTDAGTVQAALQHFSTYVLATD